MKGDQGGFYLGLGRLVPQCPGNRAVKYPVTGGRIQRLAGIIPQLSAPNTLAQALGLFSCTLTGLAIPSKLKMKTSTIKCPRQEKISRQTFVGFNQIWSTAIVPSQGLCCLIPSKCL